MVKHISKNQDNAIIGGTPGTSSRHSTWICSAVGIQCANGFLVATFDEI